MPKKTSQKRNIATSRTYTNAIKGRDAEVEDCHTLLPSISAVPVASPTATVLFGYISHSTTIETFHGKLQDEQKLRLR
jgi:hypothetical protein